MSDPKMTLPSGGGAYVRRPDGSLEQVEEPRAASSLAEAAVPAVEDAIQRPVKPNRKEA